jgi:hypothetical protein
MSQRFSFSIDKSRGLVRIAMNGLFTRGDIEDFVAARREAHAALGGQPNAHITLNDVRNMKIQTGEIVGAFREMLADPEFRSRRLAFVVGPTLTRNQLLRAVAGRDVCCFTDPASAEAWLLEEDSEPAQLRRAG